jgi:hypothetical protein
VGHEWSHAQILGQGKSLTEAGFGFFDMRRIAPRGDVAEKT